MVNWPSSNFNLASDAADWNSRVALGAPYTVDPNGTTRTTDRGAYQYCAGGGCGSSGPDGGLAPAAPTGLTATVN